MSAAGKVVWIVNVPGRVDGLYVFARPGDAHEFADAVGHDVVELSEEPVLGEADARTVIRAETES